LKRRWLMTETATPETSQWINCLTQLEHFWHWESRAIEECASPVRTELSSAAWPLEKMGPTVSNKTKSSDEQCDQTHLFAQGLCDWTGSA